MTVISGLLTPKEAAEFLGVQEQTLAVWRISGRYGLPFYKVGRRVYYKAEDLEAWLESRRAVHTGELADRDAGR